jgi:CheY-like chemotaxis protein
MKKILIIDDEEDFCYFTKANIEARGGVEVAICCDSRNAVRKVREERPDMILLDVMMPGVSGPEIAEELEDDVSTRNIPVVFATALVTGEETRRTNSAIGGRHFISKPVEINRLMFLMNKLLG